MLMLLVGGAGDGKRIEVETVTPHYRYPRPFTNPALAIELYELSSLYSIDDRTGKRETFDFYRLAGTTYAQTIRALLDGYRRPKE